MGKLGIYLLANYPTKGRFVEAVTACSEAGVDFLEIGFPFSDPVADGDVLERAAHETLGRYGFEETLSALCDVRRLFRGSIYIMTYANVVYGIGADEFAGKVGKISGIILADVPCREISRFDRAFRKHHIGLARFLTPESRAEDIESALKGATDFIYFVSKRGTTGGDFSLDAETLSKIEKVRGKGVDVYIGFGIKTKKDVELACAAADGAIIGTRAVKELGRGIGEFKKFIREIKT